MSEIRKIEVVLDAFGRTLSLGTLTGETLKGRERVSFVYEPDLPLRHIFFGPDLSPAPQAMERETLFGFLSDAAPDRWGRTLIQRKAALSALERRESVRRLHELDYLLAVDDLTRTGALRFRTQDGPFLSEHSFVPPLFELRRLERAVRDYTSGKLAPGLLTLLAPGSSLGGVRPKSCMTAPDGAFWLAKFPHRHDDWDVSAWEWTVHRLAADCGLNVGATRFERMERGRGVFFGRKIRPERRSADSLYLRDESFGSQRRGIWDCGVLQYRAVHRTIRAQGRSRRALSANRVFHSRLELRRSSAKPRFSDGRERSVAAISGIRSQPISVRYRFFVLERYAGRSLRLVRESFGDRPILRAYEVPRARNRSVRQGNGGLQVAALCGTSGDRQRRAADDGALLRSRGAGPGDGRYPTERI